MLFPSMNSAQTEGVIDEATMNSAQNEGVIDEATVRIPHNGGHYVTQVSLESDREPVTVFTPQDEQKELAELTITDIVDIQSDLTGGTLGTEGLSIKDGSDRRRTALTTMTSELSSLSSAALSLLEHEMFRLPATQTASYRCAAVECPDQVSEERKMAFLEYENGNAVLAAKRLAKYWEIRLEVFGSDRCYLPMTLTGAMKDEVVPMTKYRIWQRMSVTDTAGRAIFYFCPGRRNYAEYSAQQEFMAMWYLFETIIEDADLRRRGVVSLTDMRNMQKDQFNRKAIRLARSTESAMPFRYRAAHVCHPSTFSNYVLHPIIKYFISKDMRLRTKMHYGSEAQVLSELETYCLPRDRVPTELGGDVVLDMNQWVMERMALENARTNVSFSDGPAAKRLRNEHKASAAAAPPSKEKKKPGIKGRGKGGGRGLLMDPRMSRAVEARLADSKISLYHALVLGGFVFREDAELNDMVDADGTTLTQRKNNLCRRVRQERKRRKAEQAAKGGSLASTLANSEKVEAANSSPTSISPPIESPKTSPIVCAVPTSTQGNDAVNPTPSAVKDDRNEASGVNHTDDADAHSETDSFYESILELPGIEDLEDMEDGMDFSEEVVL